MADEKVDAKVEAAAKEGAKEGAKEERQKLEKKDLTLKNRALARASTYYRKTLDQARASPNTTQIFVTSVMTIGGAGGGYWVNQFLRKKTAEWGWVNDEGNRSIGSVLLADIAPIVVGVGISLLGAFLIKHGALSAAVTGAGLGIAGGSILSTILGPD